MDYRNNDRIRDSVRGVAFLAFMNLKHYALALFGFGLRLDPDYPPESRFLGQLVVDSVLEYRGYALLVPWALFLALAIHPMILGFVAALWTVQAWKRAYFYSSPYQFWKQAFKESPAKIRVRTRYVEEIMLEIERRLKAGINYGDDRIQSLAAEGWKIQNMICERKP